MQGVQWIMDTSQLQFFDKVVDMPMVAQRRVPRVQGMTKTTEGVCCTSSASLSTSQWVCQCMSSRQTRSHIYGSLKRCLRVTIQKVQESQIRRDHSVARSLQRVRPDGW